ncbi:HET-domain-containing protein [Byssothecium circinans]|uniref:HET-domain-containing protein n=1 Tax=Byssothecium circinans TaxID=147558 RepID=A0A6A5UE13_9PLEO|nr:HET-domain-containing protein [Byssothecium circinans]
MRGGLLLPVRRENESGYLPRGRILEPEVNFDVVRSWVKLCEMGHGDQCSHRDLKIEGLRVIDCYTKTVIEAPANCCYIALSYVWGSGSADAAPGFDWHSLPPLILDSVTCTLRLQCRYLWVDRYCIPQENFTLKHQQIRQMHTIYRHAWITIIAACCQDASSGLVGISVPRDTRFSAKIGDGEFAVASHPWYVKERLQKSKWSTRGWTFQEGLLSSRRLVFSDAEVYLQCNAPTNCLCEFESHDMQSLSTRNSTLCLEEAFPINLLPSNAFRSGDCIQEYSQRTLTNDSDALDAFTGVLNSFSGDDEELDHFWGILVFRSESGRVVLENELVERTIPTRSERLARNILWYFVRAPQRREGFPSWSWVGWRGRGEMGGIWQCE